MNANDLVGDALGVIQPGEFFSGEHFFLLAITLSPNGRPHIVSGFFTFFYHGKSYVRVTHCACLFQLTAERGGRGGQERALYKQLC